MSTTAIEPYKSGVFDLTHKLTVEKHGHTALITVNHPPANTWDRESLIGLAQVVEHLNHDDEVYALVITGQGEKFFSAGADLKLFADGDRVRARESSSIGTLSWSAPTASWQTADMRRWSSSKESCSLKQGTATESCGISCSIGCRSGLERALTSSAVCLGMRDHGNGNGPREG